MRFVADVHLHSRFSMATSRDLDLENLHLWSALKGVDVVGTGDYTHPEWLRELKRKLEPAEEGLLRLKKKWRHAVEAELPASCQRQVRFILSVEISSIYKKNSRTRKVHNVVLLPSFDCASRLNKRLGAIGNLKSDGRPILGLDSRDLLEICLDVCPEVIFIPAHIWTPHFAALGMRSGFDSLEECFEDLLPHILAVETGLSSHPPMNRRLSALDQFSLVSNSDAHSPRKLAREATCFDTELSYPAMRQALASDDPQQLTGTIEFFPEEGKYHHDGHRKCGVRLTPTQTLDAGGLCPQCGRQLTIGVSAPHRRARRSSGIRGQGPGTAIRVPHPAGGSHQRRHQPRSDEQEGPGYLPRTHRAARTRAGDPALAAGGRDRGGRPAPRRRSGQTHAQWRRAYPTGIRWRVRQDRRPHRRGAPPTSERTHLASGSARVGSLRMRAL